MKRSKFTEARIEFVLKQAEDGTSVAEVFRKARIAEATFENWRKKRAFFRYWSEDNSECDLMPSEMKHRKMLDEECQAEAVGG